MAVGVHRQADMAVSQNPGPCAYCIAIHAGKVLREHKVGGRIPLTRHNEAQSNKAITMHNALVQTCHAIYHGRQLGPSP